MNIQILVKDLLYPTLQAISSKEGLTPQQYASNIVESFLERQYRGSVVDKLRDATVEDLSVIKDNPIEDLQVKQIISTK